jgi:hypothetical protein
VSPNSWRRSSITRPKLFSAMIFPSSASVAQWRSANFLTFSILAAAAQNVWLWVKKKVTAL